MPPPAEHVWRYDHRHNRRLPGGPARDRDLGPPHPRRQPDGQVHATIVTRTQPDRWGALTFALHVDERRVVVRQAKRLQPGRDYGRSITNGESTRVRLDDALAERRLVIAAIEARGRAADGGAATPDWKHVLEHLDREITDLLHTDVVRHFTETPLRR